ncbi:MULTISPECIES: hypothetical protein [unclassified Pseudodesulfovibrio]|uniref:hypothetical protein n=1 Tax=unclassified Pseudodesulfovibrio TaxID=2661612 RepID=UPI000FEC15BB|nr:MULTISPECIES: hypothetical protein [unclassified Pseudodesulfovibrio]MCJ2166239.1 hypothetical protein [Pseudodesulfovibrio sp. S3-i]RWU02271.1 hypothetical protein DWB63_17005 [Pseudodesulfovibrio sp. S3]
MKAFISFGYYDIREQQLTSSPGIVRYLLDDVLRCLEQCPELSLGGVLYAQELSCSLPAGLPSYKLRSGERTWEELSAIRKILEEEGFDDNEVMVFRPAQGAIHAERVLHFSESLNPVASALVVSVVRFMSLSHPMWNVQVADQRFLSAGSIRQPRSGRKLVAPLAKLCPELWKASKAKGLASGSQHLQSLFHDDQALYAARMDLLPEKSEHLEVSESVICPTDPGAGDNILSRLPVFQMSRSQVFDVTGLEALLERLVACKGESLRVRAAESAPTRIHA